MIRQVEAIKFYDTNVLLGDINAIEGKIYLSSVTLRELEEIKTSGRKDESVKFTARTVTRWLGENEDKYECVVVEDRHYKVLKKFKLPETPDNLIIACAYLLDKKCTFVTNDMCCYNVAKNIFNLNVEVGNPVKEDTYKGYKVIEMTQQQLVDFYAGNRTNLFGVGTNEYLVVKEIGGEPMTAFRWDGEKFLEVSNKGVSSNHLGRLIPKDVYQMCAIDSMFNNKITMINGKAGTGKSLIAVSFLIRQLEKHVIDKIIIFCNTTKVRGAEELGYYKGTKDDKLLDGQMGSFLCSKLGGRDAVEQLMMHEKLILLPLSDVRGFDTTGMRAGIYITEAQNSTIDLMKLAMQRIGEDCIAVVDGDYDSQVDSYLYQGSNNGMRRLSEVFRGEDIYGQVELETIYRSKIANIADRM